jgi:hypothetical protein
MNALSSARRDPSRCALKLAEPPKHPTITEVLYAVPTSEGDASGDGTRDAVGDEFVELVNATDAPIQLKGYRLSDRNDASPDRKGGWSFRVPRAVAEAR